MSWLKDRFEGFTTMSAASPPERLNSENWAGATTPEAVAVARIFSQPQSGSQLLCQRRDRITDIGSQSMIDRRNDFFGGWVAPFGKVQHRGVATRVGVGGADHLATKWNARLVEFGGNRFHEMRRGVDGNVPVQADDRLSSGRWQFLVAKCEIETR